MPPGTTESRDPGDPPQADAFMDQLNQELAQDQSERDATDIDSTPESDSAPLSMFYLLLRGIAATAFVLGLILLLGYIARRFGGKSPLLAGVGLGSVIGRVYLAKGAALYYVRTGGRVLVVGVTNNTISLVGEFDAAAFDDEDAELESRFPSEPEPELEPDPDAFLSQLRGSSSAIRSAEEGDFTGDMEIDSLKGDIRRLQSLLEEESRETRS
jgi:flagellar biogenesis protein FliO